MSHINARIENMPGFKALEPALRKMPEQNASDLHIGANSPFFFRIDSELVKVSDHIYSAGEVRDVILGMLTEEQQKRLDKEKGLDFSFSIESIGRFRCNAFFQRGDLGCAIRLIPDNIMSIEECGLPADVVKRFCKLQKGLVLVTGATGSGKSTTLASMVQYINATRKCHIVTVEDPIEYVYQNDKAIIDQRQLYEDTHSFSNALRHVLRQDPDVILIGELRDLDTIQQALIIADTGHLVLGTLHTSDCIQSINRMVDVFPSHQQRQIRTQLSFVLLGILSQQLIPRTDGPGRALACEVLVANSAIRSLIRDSKEYQIYSILQTSQQQGMRTMNQALSELCAKGILDFESASLRSPDVEEFKMTVIE